MGRLVGSWLWRRGPWQSEQQQESACGHCLALTRLTSRKSSQLLIFLSSIREFQSNVPSYFTEPDLKKVGEVHEYHGARTRYVCEWCRRPHGAEGEVCEYQEYTPPSVYSVTQVALSLPSHRSLPAARTWTTPSAPSTSPPLASEYTEAVHMGELGGTAGPSSLCGECHLLSGPHHKQQVSMHVDVGAGCISVESRCSASMFLQHICACCMQCVPATPNPAAHPRTLPTAPQQHRPAGVQAALPGAATRWQRRHTWLCVHMHGPLSSWRTCTRAELEAVPAFPQPAAMVLSLPTLMLPQLTLPVACMRALQDFRRDQRLRNFVPRVYEAFPSSWDKVGRACICGGGAFDASTLQQLLFDSEVRMLISSGCVHVGAYRVHEAFTSSWDSLRCSALSPRHKTALAQALTSQFLKSQPCLRSKSPASP